ncbi:MAG TPA: hypothetical protein VJA21_12230 [Verrucomicrobiae bacterium]
MVALLLKKIAGESFDHCSFLDQETMLVRRIQDNLAKEYGRKVLAQRINSGIKMCDNLAKEIAELIRLAKTPASVAQAKKLAEDLQQYQEALREMNRQFPKVPELNVEQMQENMRKMKEKYGEGEK